MNMKKKLMCLLLVAVLTISVFVTVKAASHDRESGEEVVLQIPVSESGEVLDLPSLVNRDLEAALLDEFGTINPLEIGEEPYTRFLNDFVDMRNERIRRALVDIDIAVRADTSLAVRMAREEVLLEEFGITNLSDLPSLVNRDLEEALLEEFGTINPLEIGEEPYTRFLNNFVDMRNERVRTALAGIDMAMRADDIDALEFSADNVSPRAICPICGRSWTSPSTITTWNTVWRPTGQTRIAGVFPNQFVENLESRYGTTEVIMSCCGGRISANQVRDTRWVRAS